MVHKLVNYFFLLTIGLFFPLTDDLNGPVGTGNLAGGATRTAMLIIFIMSKYHFSSEPVKHLKDVTVFRVLLCDDLFWMGDIVSGNTHSLEQGLQTSEDPRDVSFYI